MKNEIKIRSSIGDIFFEHCINSIAKRRIILDVGSGRPFQKEMSRFKHLFSFEHLYIGLDIDKDRKPHIIADAHNLPFKDESCDAVICKAVLEHVQEPHRVMSEIRRVLKKGALLYVWAPFMNAYHGPPDYFRYTKEGLLYLLKDFTKVNIVSSGNLLLFLVDLFLNILSYRSRFIARIFAIFAKFLIPYDARLNDKTAIGYHVLAMK